MLACLFRLISGLDTCFLPLTALFLSWWLTFPTRLQSSTVQHTPQRWAFADTFRLDLGCRLRKHHCVAVSNAQSLALRETQTLQRFDYRQRPVDGMLSREGRGVRGFRVGVSQSIYLQPDKLLAGVKVTVDMRLVALTRT
ncbi:predicted protein [Plenodomus lingam JN3]|uniref:Predicted protein n=1 Tax=Leptosphaeria maculans (strain JN3 / isolate v23.1.3 / race Av1-4-5-6-7-8) TaxID=985895 RepID=E5A8V7_LEPMJ|nr:predicted protein [Plenodomus lingam JN3]CBY00052.1 predicted protein [Plenodomus lingam JN3]